MEKLSSLFGRLALTVAGALALGACNRAEYAMLPPSASYLGSKPAAYAPRPAAPAPVAATPAAAEAPAATAPVAAVAPAAPAPATPAATQRPTSAVEAPAPAVASEATVAAPAKPTFAQRLLLKKLSKKMDKLTAKAPQLKQRDASAETARISGNLRTGIILVLVGLLVSIFSGVIGTIIALIGVIFLVLWLLDEL